ncbi:MAG: leucine-rich repeat protein [Lachnospirales bacterium]
MKKNISLNLGLILSIASLALSIVCITEVSANTEPLENGSEMEMLEEMGPPPGASSSTKVTLKEGDWTFDLITSDSGTTSTITYYSNKIDETVIVPSVLGGAPVTCIASQAFGHHDEIVSVYVPASVTDVEEWAFYDLNKAQVISFANPDVKISDSAFQSSANSLLFLPENTSQSTLGGKEVNTSNDMINVTLENPSAASIAGDVYLNTEISPITVDDITSIASSTSDFNIDENTVTFEGSEYVAVENKIDIVEGLQEYVTNAELVNTFKILTQEDANLLNEKIQNDSNYSKVSSTLHYEKGAYINGNKVELSENIIAYDVTTGNQIDVVSTGQYYPYVAYKDNDDDGKIDILYYTPLGENYSYNTVEIESNNPYIDGLSARDILSTKYLSFANAVVKTSGSDDNYYANSLNLKTDLNGDVIGKTSNEERSILWADDYSSITVDHLNAISTSSGDWAKMSYESGLDSYNVELMMEWGMNALLYATNGGNITVGDLDGEESTFYSVGDGANGIIAGGVGRNENSDKKYDTAIVSVYNADFDLEGWNNHVADVVYGGYVYLEDVTSTTGIDGSYAVGQSSALANDFGNGVVEVEDFSTTVYGNRSAGAYVIGGGIINAKDSSFTSKVDAGVVSASGGTFNIEDSKIEGPIAFRNRGGIVADSTSTLSNVDFLVRKNTPNYVKGDTAKLARDAWINASGSSDLIHYMMSDSTMTIGKLCDNYNISKSKKTELLNTLSELSNETYTENTPIRNSLLDNTYYNYSAGAYTGETDYVDVPYLTLGSAFGGLVSSALEFESAGINLNIEDSTFRYAGDNNYNYLIASEAGSAPVVNFIDTNSTGIIWNEGDVNRFVEGRPGDFSSSVVANFINSSFTGSFADGSNGLWNVPSTSYTNSKGQTTSLNGNYFGGTNNWGNTVTLDKDSSWTVTKDSYIGSLTIEQGASIKGYNNNELEMTVNGVPTPIKSGTYTGEIIISVK